MKTDEEISKMFADFYITIYPENTALPDYFRAGYRQAEAPLLAEIEKLKAEIEMKDRNVMKYAIDICPEQDRIIEGLKKQISELQFLLDEMSEKNEQINNELARARKEQEEVTKALTEFVENLGTDIQKALTQVGVKQ